MHPGGDQDPDPVEQRRLARLAGLDLPEHQVEEGVGNAPQPRLWRIGQRDDPPRIGMQSRWGLADQPGTPGRARTRLAVLQYQCRYRLFPGNAVRHPGRPVDHRAGPGTDGSSGTAGDIEAADHQHQLVPGMDMGLVRPGGVVDMPGVEQTGRHAQ